MRVGRRTETLLCRLLARDEVMGWNGFVRGTMGDFEEPRVEKNATHHSRCPTSATSVAT
jgi:hypothetical protein